VALKEKLGFMIKGEFYKILLHTVKWCESNNFDLECRESTHSLVPPSLELLVWISTSCVH